MLELIKSGNEWMLPTTHEGTTRKSIRTSTMDAAEDEGERGVTRDGER